MNIKKWFKLRPYSLKCGIISIIISIIIVILFVLIQNFIENSLLDIPILWIIFIPILIISLPLIIVIVGLSFLLGGNYEVLGQSTFGILIIILLGIIYYFSLGIGIGLLIEKIKSK